MVIIELAERLNLLWTDDLMLLASDYGQVQIMALRMGVRVK